MILLTNLKYLDVHFGNRLENADNYMNQQI